MFGRKKKAEKVKLTANSYAQARNFLSFLKPYRLIYTIGWMFLLLSSITSMLFPLLMGQLMGTDSQTTVGNESGWLDYDFTSTKSILTIMLVVFAFQSIFSFFRITVFSRVTEKVLKDFRESAFKKLIRLPVDFYNKNKVGELTSRIATDITLLQETLNTTIAEFFRQFITIIIGVTYILYVSWELSLWMLAVVPVVAIIGVFFGRQVKKLSKQAQEESAKSNSVLEEVLMGIVNVKAFTNEKYEWGRYNSKISNIARLNIKNGIVRGLLVSFIIFCLFGAIAFIIWKAKQMEYAGDITNKEFISFIMYTVFLGASFGALPDLYAKIQKAIGSTEYLMDLLKNENEEVDDKPSLTEFNGNISFKGVHFSYPSRPDVPVLKGITFNANYGNTIALVGSSGAGKSTISSLLLKFYDVDQGAVMFDNYNIKDFSSASIREHTAIVPQEVILFSGSIKNNIAYGNLKATENEIIEAAKKANAFEFIQKFPDQFETEVGDRGIQLSGGQKQRIAIARAVLKNPKLLILDEATSALDTESEKLVQEALDELMKNRTSIVIAHRLSTIKNADTILVLEDGKIKAQGRHEDLIADKDGTYYQLNNAQVS